MKTDSSETDWSCSAWGREGDLRATFKYLKGTTRKLERDRVQWHTVTEQGGMASNWKRASFTISKNFFAVRVVWDWNRLPSKAMDGPSPEVFKGRLHGALSNLV